MWFVLILGCFDRTEPAPFPDMAQAEVDCRHNERVEVCYEMGLSDAVDPSFRSLALTISCGGSYKDSCRMLFELELSQGDTTGALMAASRGCKQVGDRDLCREVLAMADTHPDEVEILRSGIEAKLAELDAHRPSKK